MARVFRVTGIVGTIGDDKPRLAATLLASDVAGLGDFRQEFQSVSERVVGVKSFKARKRLVIDHRHPTVEQPAPPVLKVFDEQGRVCLPRRLEVFLDTEMDSNEVGLEPAPAADGEMERSVDPGIPRIPS